MWDKLAFYILIFVLFQTSTFAQVFSGRIEGIVKTDKGSPIPYVNIYVKNKKNIGTTTDLQGRFVFPLPNIFTNDSFIPKKAVKFELFARQYTKLNGNYYTLLECFLNIISEKEKISEGELLYMDIAIKKDPYGCHYNVFCPEYDFSLFLEYPKIKKRRKFDYAIDSVIPYDDGFVYVMSEKYVEKSSTVNHVGSSRDGDIILNEIVKDTTNGGNTRYLLNNTYYITNDFKISKVRYETIYENDKRREVTWIGSGFYQKTLYYILEKEYKETEDGFVFPYHYKIISGYDYTDENYKHIATENIISEFFVSKTEANVIYQKSDYQSGFISKNFYDFPVKNQNQHYDDFIIRDNIRRIISEDIIK